MQREMGRTTSSTLTFGHEQTLDQNRVVVPIHFESWDTRASNELCQYVRLHRSVFCVLYDDCLDEAISRKWDSFSCEKCPHRVDPAYRPIWDPAEAELDAHKCARLLAVSFHSRYRFM
jgi:hypothetical protein